MAAEYRQSKHFREKLSSNTRTSYDRYLRRLLAAYLPFEGICLTDTFQLYEQDRDMISDLMADNSNRRTRQKALDIRVIVGNPPYSVGQGSANDNAANVAYPKLDERIRATYAARSSATNKNGLYDSYIRAIRWASDRIGDAGVVAYVSNASWLDTNTFDGLRQCLSDEFASIHVFNLRGNARTSGEARRKEKDNVFGQGSRTPVAITLLVKNPAAAQQGQIHVHDIGDYLTQAEKLAIIARFGSIGGIARAKGWRSITPDEHGDWLGQRDSAFEAFLAIGDKENKASPTLFANYSSGVKTQRDAWCYNPSREALAGHMRAMIGFYNAELARFDAALPQADRKAREASVSGFIDSDPTKISWSDGLKNEVIRGNAQTFDPAAMAVSLYRPFTRQWLYYNRTYNERVYQMPRIFPDAAADTATHVSMSSGCLSGCAAKPMPRAVMSAATTPPHSSTGRRGSTRASCAWATAPNCAPGRPPGEERRSAQPASTLGRAPR